MAPPFVMQYLLEYENSETIILSLYVVVSEFIAVFQSSSHCRLQRGSAIGMRNPTEPICGIENERLRKSVAVHKHGCGGRTRTYDLRVMSHYHSLSSNLKPVK